MDGQSFAILALGIVVGAIAVEMIYVFAVLAGGCPECARRNEATAGPLVDGACVDVDPLIGRWDRTIPDPPPNVVIPPKPKRTRTPAKPTARRKRKAS
jgi:hypothetical protein